MTATSASGSSREPAVDPVVISVLNVGKAYRLFDRPVDRLRERLFARFGHSYGTEFWALRDVTFEVARGERFGIIGRNGAGKSTLLQILAGVLTATAGEVRTTGRLSALLELGTGFNPEFTGRENARIYAAVLGLSPEEIEDHLEDMIAFADIGAFVDQPVKLYSSGMLVRLAFAVTTHVSADIVVIDEALAVGDVFFRQKCYRHLNRLLENGVSVVLVSHAMTEVQQFCRRVLLLDRGRPVFLGPAGEAVRRYYMLEQQERSPVPASDPADGPASFSSMDVDDLPGPSFPWPGPEVFVDITRTVQVSNGWARLTAVALCDSDGRSRRSFEQGERAVILYEFELLHDIEVPIFGALLTNDKGVIVHGKNTLEYGTLVPEGIAAGALLRCRQEVSLEIAVGEYTLDVGLTTVSSSVYAHRSVLDHEALWQHILRLADVAGAATLVVTPRRQARPVQLLHHGIANLPGSAALQVVAASREGTAASTGVRCH